MAEQPKHAVASGDPFGAGIMLHGPFETHDDALDWAEQECGDHAWWIVPLNEP